MTSSIARIKVNGIDVGSLPRSTYNEIVASVRSERRLYLSYASAVFGVFLRMLSFISGAWPALWFILFVVVCVISPDAFSTILTALRDDDPLKLFKMVQAAALYTFTIVAVGVPAVLALVSPEFFRVQNPFQEEIDWRIRNLLEVPAAGCMCVHFVDDLPAIES